MTYQKIIPPDCPKNYQGIGDDTCFKCMTNRSTSRDFSSGCPYDYTKRPRGTNIYCFECSKLFFKQKGQYGSAHGHGKFCCKECCDKHHSRNQSWISTRHLLDILEFMKDGKYYTIMEITNELKLRKETIGMALRGMLTRNFVERVMHYDAFSDRDKSGWALVYYKLTPEGIKSQQIWADLNKPLTEPTPEKLREVAEWEQKRIENEMPNHQDTRWDEQIVPQQTIDINKDKDEHLQNDIPLPPNIKIISEADMLVDKFLSSEKDALTIDLPSVARARKARQSLYSCLKRRQLTNVKTYQKGNHVIIMDKNKIQYNVLGSSFTADEIKYIQDNYATMTCKQIGTALKRSGHSVWRKANRLGLHKKLPTIMYTPDEVKYIQENYATMPIIKISAVLGKTINSIYAKAYKLGLHKITLEREENK